MQRRHGTSVAASGVKRQRARRDTCSLCCPRRTEATHDEVAYAKRESSPRYAGPAIGDEASPSGSVLTIALGCRSAPRRTSATATKRNSAWTPCLPPGSKQGLASAAARRCCLRLEGRADAGRRDRTRRFAAVLTQARPRRASLRRGGCPRLVAFRPARPRRRPKTSLGSNSVSHRPSSLRGTTSLANGPGDSRGPARRAGLPPAPTRPAGRRPRHDLSPLTRITRVVSDFAILRLVWLVWLLGGSNAKLVRC